MNTPGTFPPALIVACAASACDQGLIAEAGAPFDPASEEASDAPEGAGGDLQNAARADNPDC